MQRLAFLLCVLTATLASAERRFALLVGANDGWATDRPLRYAHDDAKRMREVMTQLGGVSEGDVTLLLDPSTEEVTTALANIEKQLATVANEPTMLLFYYSGHSDAAALHLRGPALSMVALADSLSTSKASLTLAVLDACRSGAILNTKGAAPTVPVRLVADEPTMGFALLSSSGADELAQESRALAGSIFTHHWISALRGAGDTDSDGVVRLSEAYGYAYERTRADTESSALPQRPGFRFNLKGQGDVALTRLMATAGTIELEVEPTLRYVVVDATEQRLVAEARSNPTERRRLQLAAGAYRIKRPRNDGIEVAEINLVAGSVLWATRLEYRKLPLDSGLVKGGSAFADWAASGRLAEGDVDVALKMFDRMLDEDPHEVRARRGKARALLVRADELKTQGKTIEELNTLNEAMSLDPTFKGDPSVERYAARRETLQAELMRTTRLKRELDEEVANNPRLLKRWGFGIDLLSTRGLLAIEASYLPLWWLWVSVSVDLIGPGVDLSVKVVPLVSSWSPTFGIGGHYGFDAWKRSASFNVTTSVNGVPQPPSPYSYDDYWGTMLHADVGIQWMSKGGFMVEIGGGPMLFFDKKTGAPGAFGMANIVIGWFFH